MKKKGKKQLKKLAAIVEDLAAKRNTVIAIMKV